MKKNTPGRVRCFSVEVCGVGKLPRYFSRRFQTDRFHAVIPVGGVSGERRVFPGRRRRGIVGRIGGVVAETLAENAFHGGNERSHPKYRVVSGCHAAANPVHCRSSLRPAADAWPRPPPPARSEPDYRVVHAETGLGAGESDVTGPMVPAVRGPASREWRAGPRFGRRAPEREQAPRDRPGRVGGPRRRGTPEGRVRPHRPGGAEFRSGRADRRHHPGGRRPPNPLIPPSPP